jgi:endoglucanase
VSVHGEEPSGLPLLQLAGREIQAQGRPVALRGIGIGNWMLLEHFMLGLPQVDHVIRRAFRDVLGERAASAFWDRYMDAYLTIDDIASIRALGFNHVRLAFDYRHLESDWQPGEYLEQGFALLDRVVDWCAREGLWVLLDLHAAPGCQATDWNAGSENGEALFWDVRDFQDRAVALWGEIARRYRDEPAVMGYEILNEPVTRDATQAAHMNDFTRSCLAAIRKQDPQHIVIVNGDRHATDLAGIAPDVFDDPQVMAAFHFYHQYTPPLRTIEQFPGVHDGLEVDERYLVEQTGLAQRSARDRIERPEYLGEFGIHYWAGSPAAVDAQRSILETTIRYANRRGIHWNLWHYKDVRGMGLLSMREDTPWMAFLRETGVADRASAAAAARERYVAEMTAMLSLSSKQRLRLAAEAERDVQLELLYDAVGHLRGRSLRDLEELAASFESRNFIPDARIEAALRRLTSGQPAGHARPGEVDAAR